MAKAARRTPVSRMGLTREEKMSRYIWAILIAYLVWNPLSLYRFSAISDNLLINGLFNFSGYWQQNPVGLSLVELGAWAAFSLPGYETVFGMPIAWQAKGIVGLVIAGLLIWAAYAIVRKVWLSLNSFNNRWAYGTFFKKAAIIGIPVAIVMLAVNWAAGVSFSAWTIAEIVLWLAPAVIGSTIAAGLCWNFENRRDSGALGINATMGDPQEYEHDHHGDDV